MNLLWIIDTKSWAKKSSKCLLLKINEAKTLIKSNDIIQEIVSFLILIQLLLTVCII